jgi:hypothetical protein
MSKSSVPLPAITLGLLFPLPAWDACGRDLAPARLADDALGFPLLQHGLPAGVLHPSGPMARLAGTADGARA